MEILRMRATKFLFLLLVVALCFSLGQSITKVFNIKDYGAVEGGNVDSSQALLKAWNDACKWNGGSEVVVSSTYLVNPVILKGPCSSPIMFNNSGILKSPVGLRGDYWIDFQYIDQLSLFGGGYFDGQGPPQQAQSGLPTLLRFTFVTNSRVRNVKLLNSLSTHVHIFGSDHLVLKKIQISSPGDSPNTDGIKIGESHNIRIVDTTIASGDDCVAILRGSKNITVVRVVCGPGHGISIGSMGSTPGELVERVVVRHCKLFNTTNGLRIKSWANDNRGLVSNILFEDITMDHVENPIIIEQNYCPAKNCPQDNSRIQIYDVKFRNIRGTTQTNAAVSLQCSGSNPCKKIELKDIYIKHVINGVKTVSKCSNARGQALGIQMPTPCIS